MPNALSLFGEELEKILMDRGLSNREFSRMMGWETDPNRLYKLCRRTRPHNATIRKVADALEMRPSDFYHCFR